MTSSIMRMSGSTWTATANPSRTYIPLEYTLTGESMNRSSPANPTTSSKTASISRLRRPRIAPLR